MLLLIKGTIPMSVLQKMTQYKNPWNKVKKCIIKTVKEKQTFPFINSIICVTSLKIN